ncbi:MAG: glutamate mutase L [Betaproteobacteria bacterium]|nr:glutamate mutase L [Betaproteobacteria bacterium]
MARLAFLTDFGSTYTKVCAVETGTGRLVGRAHAPTTVDTDVAVGWRQAVARLHQEHGVALSDASVQLACSSAGGGLRMVVVGFVPRLTAKAGQIAALGAGAKVVGTFSFRLSETQIQEIRDLSPDILLLCGGIDGGDTDTVLANAGKLAAGSDWVTVFAGNRDARAEVERLYAAAGRPLKATENVMPEVGDVSAHGISDLIREIFADHVIKAKGIDRVRELTGHIVMPTPAAVFVGLELLCSGARGNGLGELVAVDVGGATTDVYSFAHGRPTRPDVVPRGLREPYGKRTVEGDMGVRLNAPSVIAAAESCGLGVAPERLESFKSAAAKLPFQRSWLPSTDEEKEFDLVLASVAVAAAMRRHAGRLTELFTLDGRRWLQEGKDLSEISTCIGTGGPLVHNPAAMAILVEGLKMANGDPMALVPRGCSYLFDRYYCLYAVGLLRQINPEGALHLGRSTLGLSEEARANGT